MITSPVRSPVVLTIGHSTRTLGDFISLLETHAVKRLVDVRTLPRSKRHPQFDRDALREVLDHEGIEYSHAPALGGLRHPRPDSINLGWRDEGFRGFADHMQTEEFRVELDALLARAAFESLVLMCAEALPERCHRSLIADALTILGTRVEHIVNPSLRRPHSRTPWADVRGGRILYPAPQLDLEG